MSTRLIIGWVYKKGELAQQQLDNWIAGITAICSIVLTVVVIGPTLKTNIPFTSKVSSSFTLLGMCILIIIIYWILKIIVGSIFDLYQKIKGIKEEEILFTDNKITSTYKTWILNDDCRQLTMVKFDSPKKELLEFKGTETKAGKKPFSYTVSIPVPKEELEAAEKILEHFKGKLA
ncbi:hypothetical protein [Ferruginibacter sp.]